jgi:hypothetical protein
MGLRNDVSALERGGRATSWLLICLMTFTGTGCAAVLGLRGGDFPSTGVRASWATVGIRDAREDFQREFCYQYSKYDDEKERDCRSWAWQPAPSSATAHTVAEPRSVASASRSLVVIPGIFGECVAEWVTPFSDSYEDLRQQGHTVFVIPVSGRGSSALNATIIHTYMVKHRDQLENALVVAYSKGLSDFMLAATRPEAAAWRDQVSALVSVAGTANGSPIANRSDVLYEKLLKKMPLERCGPADGGGVASLTYRQAMTIRDGFLAMPDPVPVYTVAAVSSPTTVNPVLRPFLEAITTIDDRNDGQVLLEDAALPRSTLLGVYHADHWSIALPFEMSHAWQAKALGVNNHFPRRALIAALMNYVPRQRIVTADR